MLNSSYSTILTSKALHNVGLCFDVEYRKVVVKVIYSSVESDRNVQKLVGVLRHRSAPRLGKESGTRNTESSGRLVHRS